MFFNYEHELTNALGGPSTPRRARTTSLNSPPVSAIPASISVGMCVSSSFMHYVSFSSLYYRSFSDIGANETGMCPLNLASTATLALPQRSAMRTCTGTTTLTAWIRRILSRSLSCEHHVVSAIIGGLESLPMERIFNRVTIRKQYLLFPDCR